MNSDNRDKISEIVKSIGYVDQLTTEQLIEISRNLFELICFDGKVQWCDRYYHKDRDHHEHILTCKSCQQKMFLYYLGRCMDKLAKDGRLPQFNEENLSSARVCDRTFGHFRIGSELVFSIVRHLNAWRWRGVRMQEITQTWVFDFTDLSLKRLSYDVSTIGISVRRLMESRSEWKGTATKLLTELRKVAEVLKINTNSDPWPRSSYRLNLKLQELKEYLEEFGLTIVKQRYVRIIKNQ
jgi:hypothetical protein